MIRPDEAQTPWTVSELAREIRSCLEPLRSVFLKGEVSGVKLARNGHYYFTIKDAECSVSAILFRNDLARAEASPEDGREYLFWGRVDYWMPAGMLRFVVSRMRFDDVGRMRAELEALKLRLEMEGAFASERKRALPFLPRVVALVTSPTGAVIHDLQETIFERFPNMRVLVYPAAVQGASAPASVASALDLCNREGIADVVVVARGGGSFEELYGFNSELVVRAILNSAIPVVTALGHTSDRTLADMAADAECRTPTEAGARVVPRKADLRAQLDERRRQLEREVVTRLAESERALDSRRHRLQLASTAAVALRRQRLTQVTAELERLRPEGQIQRRGAQLAERRLRLTAAAALTWRRRLAELAARRAAERLRLGLEGRLKATAAELAQRSRRLLALGPEEVLERGYSITRSASGRVLRSARETQPGERLQVTLARGSLLTLVEEVRDGS